MKKILFVTGFPLNNKSAGQNYSLHLVNDLNKDYQLDVIYWSFEQHKSLINNYLLECRPNSFFKTIVYSIIFIIFPLFVVRFDLNVLHYIKNNALKYDVLYFDFSQTFIYSLFVKHPCKIMMCHDVIAQKYSRNPFSFLYLWLVRISENKLLKTASTIFNFSNKDRFLIKSLYKIDSLVVPFYIDDKITQIDFSTLKLKPFFLFYGAWNRVENREGLHWFLEKILPNISSSIQFKIIGGGLTNKNILNIISQTKNVEYLGFVNNP